MTTNEKNELISRLQSATGLSADDKAALTRLLRTQQYGLVWEEKPEDVEELLRTQMPVLTEVKEKAIISNDPQAPDHILIEGDNLEALNALAYTHEGKIDVIYIDPPYNTGNKDFVYNDSFVDVEDGYRHSKWLSFMDKRLRLAKKLLSDKGVIFISIDDNEQANLKLLCDEVFGESNFVATYFWKRTDTPPALSYKVRKKLEYVLCYNKVNIPGRKFAQGYTDGGDAPLLNNGNPIGRLCFPPGSVHFNLPDGKYTDDPRKSIKLIDDVEVFDGVNSSPFIAEAHFKWQQSNLENEVAKGTYFVIKSSQFSIRYQKAERSLKVPSNIIDGEVGVDTNEEAAQCIENLNLSTSFDYAKPISLPKYLCRMPFWEEKNTTILDFFAGSGTTLHATMQLNAEDGGHRQCILVTNNENNICEEVTYERNRRVIQGYTNAKGQQVDGLTGNNLRYYRVEHVARQNDNRTLRELMQKSTDLLCIKEGVYHEEREFAGLKFKPSVARYFCEGERRMLIIYNELAVAPIAARVAECGATKEHPLKVYVFSNGRYAYEDELHAVATLVEVCAMPEALLQSMQSTLPPLHYGEEDYTPDADAAAEALADNYNYKEEEGEA